MRVAAQGKAPLIHDGDMTTEQARVLHGSLRESREAVGYETVSGRLDGVRTRRRIFYLERESGSTIQGAVAPDLLDEIKLNLDRPVTLRSMLWI